MFVDLIGKKGQHCDVDAILDEIEEGVDAVDAPLLLLYLDDEDEDERHEVDELLGQEEQQRRPEELI